MYLSKLDQVVVLTLLNFEVVDLTSENPCCTVVVCQFLLEQQHGV